MTNPYTPKSLRSGKPVVLVAYSEEPPSQATAVVVETIDPVTTESAVETEAPPEPVAETAPVTEAPETPVVDTEPVILVPSGTSFEIISWVDNDPQKALAALEKEQKEESPRKTLIRELNRVIGSVDD